MPVGIRRRGDVTILEFTGSFGRSDARQMDEQVVATVNSALPKILLNLGEVTYIDSSGLGTLINSYTTAERKAGKLKLYAVTRKLRDLLAISKLLTVFDAFDTKDEAIKSFA